jgi:hypothetical protein
MFQLPFAKPVGCVTGGPDGCLSMSTGKPYLAIANKAFCQKPGFFDSEKLCAYARKNSDPE